MLPQYDLIFAALGFCILLFLALSRVAILTSRRDRKWRALSHSLHEEPLSVYLHQELFAFAKRHKKYRGPAYKLALKLVAALPNDPQIKVLAVQTGRLNYYVAHSMVNNAELRIANDIRARSGS